MSNMSALFLVAAQALGLLLGDRPRGGRAWSGWATAFGVVGVLVLPWLLRASGFWYPGRLGPGGGGGPLPGGQEALSLLAFPYTFFTLFWGFGLGPSTAELHRPDRLHAVVRALPTLALGAAVAGVTVIAGLRKARRRSEIVLWLVFPFVVLAALRLFEIKTFTPRYLAVALLPALLLAARGLATLPIRVGRLISVLVVLLSLWSLGEARFNARYAKDDLRSAAAWVDAHATPDEPVLVPAVTGLYRTYVRGPEDVKDFWNAGVMIGRARVRAELEARIGDARGAWLVLCRSAPYDPGDHLAEVFAARPGTVTRRDFPGVRVLHWQAPDSTDAKGAAP